MTLVADESLIVQLIVYVQYPKTHLSVCISELLRLNLLKVQIKSHYAW